jgi:hypothetical protein
MATPAIGTINPNFRKQRNGGFCYEVYGTNTVIFVAKLPGGFQCLLIGERDKVLANGWYDVSGINTAAILFLFDESVQNALANDNANDTDNNRDNPYTGWCVRPLGTEDYDTNEDTESEPVAEPVTDNTAAEDTTKKVNEWGIVYEDYYTESGIFCKRKYADREAAKYDPMIWYLRYPNLPKDEMATAIAEGVEKAKQFVSEANRELDFQSVAGDYIHIAIFRLEGEVIERGREARMAAAKAEEERKRWHEETPLGTALRNTGHRLIDNVRAVEGRYQKRGITWQPLRKLAPTPPGYSDLAGDLERDLRGGSREPEYREERTMNDWGRSRAIVYEVNADGSSCNGRVYR